MKIIQIMPADDWYIRTFKRGPQHPEWCNHKALVAWGLTESGEVLPLCTSADGKSVIDASGLLDENNVLTAMERE